MVIGTTNAVLWRETLTPSAQHRTPRTWRLPVRTRADVDPTAQTCTRLRASMSSVSATVATLSPVSRQLVSETSVVIDQLLVFCAERGRADAELRAVQAIVEDHLPASLDAFRRLPRRFAYSRRNADGHTAADELEIQLRLVRDRAVELAVSLYDADALRLQQQTTFLRAKYGRTELDLSGVRSLGDGSRRYDATTAATFLTSPASARVRPKVR